MKSILNTHLEYILFVFLLVRVEWQIHRVAPTLKRCHRRSSQNVPWRRCPPQTLLPAEYKVDVAEVAVPDRLLPSVSFWFACPNWDRYESVLSKKETIQGKKQERE